MPNADAIAGTKYIARRFVCDVARAERLRRRSIPGRFALQPRLAGRTSRALRHILQEPAALLAVCPTVLGRIHTRVAMITLPALLALVLSPSPAHGWLVVIGTYLLMGIALDVLAYSRLRRDQPPRMTPVLGLAELGLLSALVGFLAAWRRTS